MRLRLERELRVSCEIAWPHLTLPALMNAWSEARVEAATGRGDAAGDRRTVTVPALGLRARLEEVVLESEAPSRFVYTVTRGRGIRDHRGEITLTPTAHGAALVWQVSFSSAVPLLERVMGALVRPPLERSLDKLVLQLARER